MSIFQSGGENGNEKRAKKRKKKPTEKNNNNDRPLFGVLLTLISQSPYTFL